jgi:hypothetical protein
MPGMPSHLARYCTLPADVDDANRGRSPAGAFPTRRSTDRSRAEIAGALTR